MSHDISHILESWEFDPDRTYRRIIGDDGREKVQVRVDNAAFQGVLQMQMDGRPDGRRPYGHDFAFDYYRLALKRYEKANGSAEGFTLDESSCDELFDESMRIYNRYIFLLQLQDYPRVVRDTERNMELFRFVNRFAEREEDSLHLERWWPYILRMNGTARAMLAIKDERDFDTALEIIADTSEKIENLEEVEAEEFSVERERSRKALEDMARSIRATKPRTEAEKLRNELEEAVAQERFEEAAQLRDRLRDMDGEDSG